MSVDPKSLEGTFIDVEVDDSIADDAELAAKLAEVCPVDIFAADGGRVDDRPREPRRVRALQPLRRRRPRGHDPHRQALRVGADRSSMAGPR